MSKPSPSLIPKPKPQLPSNNQPTYPPLNLCSSSRMLVEPRCSTITWGFLLVLGTSILVGCDSGPPVAPVQGKVLYNGEPLPFGSVTFQPSSGQPAKGEIQPDGTFTLSTFAPNDGAIVGTHKVRIACYTSQDPNRQQPTGGEQSLGQLLIPREYTMFDTSKLTAEVKPEGNEPLVFELTGPPQNFPR